MAKKIFAYRLLGVCEKSITSILGFRKADVVRAVTGNLVEEGLLRVLN